MPDDEVVVVDYDERWPLGYDSEVERLEAVMPISVRFEHVGSTAVPGLCAKPVVDILIGDVFLRPLVFYARRLEPLGYFSQESGEPGRYFFRKVPRNYHVHIVRRRSWDWYSKVWYRDRLRNDDAYRQRYASLKQELAVRHRNDRNAYSKAKDKLVEEGLRQETLSRLVRLDPDRS
jgi:GrpB-like predicted nucleotidyltransferase (UPF0157 family)